MLRVATRVFAFGIFRKREKTDRTSFRLRALGARQSGFRDGVEEKNRPRESTKAPPKAIARASNARNVKPM